MLQVLKHLVKQYTGHLSFMIYSLFLVFLCTIYFTQIKPNIVCENNGNYCENNGKFVLFSGLDVVMNMNIPLLHRTNNILCDVFVFIWQYIINIWLLSCEFPLNLEDNINFFMSYVPYAGN